MFRQRNLRKSEFENKSDDSGVSSSSQQQTADTNSGVLSSGNTVNSMIMPGHPKNVYDNIFFRDDVTVVDYEPDKEDSYGLMEQYKDCERQMDSENVEYDSDRTNTSLSSADDGTQNSNIMFDSFSKACSDKDEVENKYSVGTDQLLAPHNNYERNLDFTQEEDNSTNNNFFKNSTIQCQKFNITITRTSFSTVPMPIKNDSAMSSDNIEFRKNISVQAIDNMLQVSKKSNESGKLNNSRSNNHQRVVKRKWPNRKINIERKYISSLDTIFLYNFHERQSWMKDDGILNEEQSWMQHDSILNEHVKEDLEDLEVSIFNESIFDSKPREGGLRLQSPTTSSHDSCFKLPIKRPPTRPKFKTSFKSSVGTNPSDKDDVISLFDRSSILEEENALRAECFNKDLATSSDTECRIKEWLKTSQKSFSSTSGSNKNIVTDSIRVSNLELPTRSPTEENIEPLHTLLDKAICASNNKCLEAQLVETIIKTIKSLSLDTADALNEVYGRSQRNSEIFDKLFDTFVNCFVKFKEDGRFMLLDMINHVLTIFKSRFTDKTSYIDSVVKGLQATGLSFAETIEYIVIRHGINTGPLNDILLYIISKSEHIEDAWEWVHKIIACRKENLDHHVVIDMLKWCLEKYPPKIKLCNTIYEHIKSRGLLDEEKIPKAFRASINMMNRVSCQNSADERPLCVPPYNNGNESDALTDVDSCLSRSSLTDQDYDPDVMNVHYRRYGENQDESISQGCSESKTSMCPEICAPNYSPITIKPPASSQDSQLSRSRPETPANVISHPVGKSALHPSYVCNKSLHNLYPAFQLDKVEISSNDVVLLKNVLGECNAREFLCLLRKYDSPVTIENFTVNAFTLIKQRNDAFIHFLSFVRAIEVEIPKYMRCRRIKAVLEVISFNLLFTFEMKGLYDEPYQLLLEFKDWPNLVTSKVFALNNENTLSHMKRFIFIAKICARAKHFHWVNELLQSPNLNLLHPMKNWGFTYDESDIHARNKILDQFFTEGYEHNFIAVNDLYKYILNGIKSVERVDLWRFFNNMLTNCLNDIDNRLVELKYILQDILTCYAQYISNNNLRAYFYLMRDVLKKNNLLALFNLCCHKGIYHRYKGTETNIIIWTTMFDFEIEVLLDCYFTCTDKNNPHDVKVVITLPDETPDSPKVFQNTHRSIFAVFHALRRMLQNKFNILVDENVDSTISISKHMIRC